MCVVALAWRAHPRWELVAIGNRDEYHDRAAAPLARWEDADHLLAGRDLQSGGTWLGVSEQGLFAVVTNLRGYGLPEEGLPSRGALVTELLAGIDPDAIALDDYNPANLITIGGDRARFLSNRPEVVRTGLGHGLYGLSNGALDEPWPKTLRLKSILLGWLTHSVHRRETLLDGLREDSLPDIGRDPATPSDVPLEPSHSPIFIRNPVYGTRCSSVITVDRKGQGLFIERRYSATGEAAGETRRYFSWPV